MTYNHINVETVTPTIGAHISGVDLNNITDQAVYDEIRKALWEHHVVFFRDQEIDPEPYIELGKQFGELEEHEFFPTLDSHNTIQVIAHENAEKTGTDQWHTDVTFRTRPNSVSVLRCVEMPECRGGDTLWMSTAAAFDALDEPLKDMIREFEADHDMPWFFRSTNYYELKGGNMKDQSHNDLLEQEINLIRANPYSTHPMVINHPVTGRETLFVNSIWTKRIRDLSPELSSTLLNYLYGWVHKPDFAVRFKWEENSVAIWDNFATQHYATHDYGWERRVMQRMTAGSAVPKSERLV